MRPFFALLLCLFCVAGVGTALAQNLTVYSDGHLVAGTTRQLTAYVPLVDPRVTWTVNGVPGGGGAYGTVTSSGLYTAPNTIPQDNVVKVGVVSVADPSKIATAALTITQAEVFVWSARPTEIPAGEFSVTLNGAGFTPQSGAMLNDMAVKVTYNSPTSISLSGTIPATWTANKASIVVFNPGLGATHSDPLSLTIARGTTTTTTTTTTTNTTGNAPIGAGKGTANLGPGRFLEQAAFGPTSGDMARVQQLGIDGWLIEQFALPETDIPIPTGNGVSPVQSQYLARLANSPDQLRQRAIDALSRIIVISANKNIYPNELAPYLQILSRNAFGNYRTLLGEITTSAQMGKYLDLANSNKPTKTSAPNENYAREVIQLFTIGLVRLNMDGSPVADANGRTIPTYDQSTIGQVALALTGWTYQGPNSNNWENFSGPLIAKDGNHDTSAKSFLGCNLPANQTTVADTNATLDCLFNHPNVPPFIATRLIKAMVKSNPSAAYVTRVATAFANNGQGVRGDLKAIFTAILKDPEARDDTAPPTAGRLKDPIYHVVSFVRALGGSISATNGMNWQFLQLAEAPLAPPSVFSFYSPLYRLPGTATFGPEFQIYTPTEAVLRGNLFWQVITNPGQDTPVSLQSFISVANDTTQLVDAVDQALLYGRMPQAMRQSLANAVNAQGDTQSRVRTALHLTALSSFHVVQY